MLSEFRKLKTPPPEQEQIDLISKHALEKYRVALYGTSVSSVMDLLLRAHELHVVLGPSSCFPTSGQSKAKLDKGTFCYKCSRPDFTSRTCPDCNPIPRRSSQRSESPEVRSGQNPDAKDTNNGESSNGGGSVPFVAQKENYRGGRMIRRGNPPSRR
ncbi:hypothetical protein E1301_Tti022256 [Triplophysa tibetana]|uniref:Uncharacterized protein n=1 Tax=Triplophysa tibetana TaxID=1572043 RepID=A0A5A9NFM1_9TELE|nr:hypothetical protein E1301_Tti022256 [Triplophysa tibetana]